MPDPNLSDVHADLVARFEHDKRIRHLEVDQATLSATMTEVKATLPAMEKRLTDAIIANKPAPPWQGVTAIVAIVMLVLTLAGIAYMQ